MDDRKKIMCPSSKASIGAKLLGVRQNDGTIAILPKPLLIDELFTKNAVNNSSPGRQFRFTNKCLESGCKQWKGNRCNVSDQIITAIDILSSNTELPVCDIRPQCRWFIQNGTDACKVCPIVISETTSEEWEDQSTLF